MTDGAKPVSELETLIRLQAHDTRIARLEADAARLPRELEAVQAAVAETRKVVDTAKGRLETARKEMRARERELDDIAARRGKSEARLYEVKTNVEYTAVLTEIEAIKSKKAQTEEEILGLMEQQETLSGEIREAEGRLKVREDQARQEEVVVRQRLAAIEADLGGLREERLGLARQLPAGRLTDYERILRARNGVGLAPVTIAGVCGGCRVSIRPQALQELRAATEPLRCESCGRFLYWQDP
jgi:predicted  nucleic acid-binding Zn-ribbon protein